jgi:peptidoglycan/xylan/chitin deacetylase (PgdA/CDA1 family)
MIKSGLKQVARFGAKSVFAAADVVGGARPGPRILIYHQVGAGLGRQMEVTERNFRQQLDWIQSHGRVVGLEHSISERGSDESSRMFVLTFDDGYRDVYETAWPIMRDRGLPFTLYLTTDPVESQIPLTSGGLADPLTWNQVNEMLESGLMTLGAHTHTHVDLRHLDHAAITGEIETSNTLIEQRTGVDARHFTYPWGYWSQSADDVVRGAYDSATIGSGAPVIADTDPYRVNRVPVQLSDGTLFFKRKATRGMRLEDVARRKLTGYDGP